tara:strand:- start:1189 stop:2448 length:1260 start_codon:yes stop_codon:yes gene_type:complete
MEIVKGAERYNRVPARYGDISRMVAHILRNNSENAVNNAPQITISVQSIQPAKDRIQDPFLVDTNQVAEREWDVQSGSYTSAQGNLYTTQRYMPVPYNLNIQVDIWTTNTDTKLQILEQILVIFNPGIQLQVNDNPLDWTSVFEVELTDINWSSRSLPAGTDESLDISTLTFAVPIWISPPAKVKKQTIIQRIINDIHSVDSIADLGFDSSFQDFFGSIADDATVIVSPSDYKVQLVSGGATLQLQTGVPTKWLDIIEMHGELSATSRLEFNISSDPSKIDQLVIGGITKNPLDDNNLVFNIDADTLPSDTLTAVDKIIDPGVSRPGGTLIPQATGQRYLITESIVPTYVEFGGISASENDIIEYDGNSWSVVFDASTNSDTKHFMKNTHTTQQYKWTGTQWISSWQGTYNPGFWRLIL